MYDSCYKSRCCILLGLLALCLACNDFGRPVGRGTAKYGWNAERYFRNQPQVVALCDAISAHDLEEIDRLIDTGVDINARGAANMTPLLWAYPERNLPLLKHLLDRGADPNVLVLSEFSSKGLIKPGQAVTHVALFDRDVRYFELVFANGGDLNLLTQNELGFDAPPLTALIKSFLPDKRERISALIRLGADVNAKASTGETPAIEAVTWFGQYDIAVELLEAGADWRVYHDNWLARLPHMVLQEKQNARGITPNRAAAFKALWAWLERDGADFDEVKDDYARWNSWQAKGSRYAAEEQRKEAARNRRRFEAEHTHKHVEANATP